MSKIQIKSDFPHTYVGVPNAFVDTYMAEANGEFVKVYLYLLRCMNCQTPSCSISAIADHFNHTEKDVLRALKYWEKVGVIALEFDSNKQISSLCFKDLNAAPVVQVLSQAPVTPVATPVIEPKASPVEVKKPLSAADKKREYTLDEKKAFSNNHEVSELLFIIETYLKHPLNDTEMNTIFFWYDGLKFSGELIEYMVEYCITNGHSSLRYMDKVAIGWADNGIDTITKAKEHVSIRSKAYYSIMKAFGISGRNLADSEMQFVNKWSKEFAFDIELIQEACKRTLSATQKPSFEYADSILTNWYNNQVHTLKDVEALDAAFNKSKQTKSASHQSVKRNSFNSFNQRQYGSGELEKIFLTTSIQ